MSANGVDRAHQVVLVRAVRRALVVGVVLVEVDRGRCPASGAAIREASSMTCSPALSHRTTSSGRGHLGRGVLRVGVVDVEPRAVGEDHVGQAEVLVGELARVGELAAQVEAARVAQRRLLLEVPAGPARLDRGAGVGVDHLRAGDHRVGVRLALHRDAVLDLGAHHPSYGHGPSLRATPDRPWRHSPTPPCAGHAVDEARTASEPS